jgi:hypothetical protein
MRAERLFLRTSWRARAGATTPWQLSRDLDVFGEGADVWHIQVGHALHSKR